MDHSFLWEQTNACLEGKKAAHTAQTGKVNVCSNRTVLKVNLFLVYWLRIIPLCYRKPECDIRIQLPNVSLEHAVVKVDEEDKVQ